MKSFKYLIGLACLCFAMPAQAAPPDFRTDRVITAEEIEPAVVVLNDWTKKLYPTFTLKYSSNPNASQAQGYIAMKGSYRLIGLFISKYVSNGAKSTLFLKGHNAKPATTAYIFDQLRAASYAEGGTFESLSMGNLNDTPGSVLVGLVENGARLPEGGSGPAPAKPDVSSELSAIRAQLNSIERKTQ